MFDVVVLLFANRVLITRRWHPVADVSIGSYPLLFRNNAPEVFDLSCHCLTINAVDADEGCTHKLRDNLGKRCATAENTDLLNGHAERDGPMTRGDLVSHFSGSQSFMS